MQPFNKLKKVLEGAVAQVVPGDNKTYASVQRSAPVATTPPPAPKSYTPAATTSSGNGFINTAKMFSPVAMVGSKSGRNFLNTNIVQPTIQIAKKSGNTLRAGGASAVGTADAGYQSVFGTDASYQNAVTKANKASQAPLKRGAYLTPQQATSRGDGFKGLNESFVKPVAQATTDIAPFVVPLGGLGKGASLGKQVAINAAANGAVGGATDVSNQYLNTGKVDTKEALRATGMGAALGGALPVAGAGARAIARNAPSAVQAADKALLTPRVNVQDQAILRDFSDMHAGAYNARPGDRAALIAQARQVGARYGVDLSGGNPADLLERTNSVLDRVGQQSRTARQGGFLKLPGGRPEEPNLASIQQNDLTGRTYSHLQNELERASARGNTNAIARAKEALIRESGDPALAGGEMSAAAKQALMERVRSTRPLPETVLPPNLPVRATESGLTPPPSPPVRIAAPGVAQKTTRYASKTVPESEYVSNAVGQEAKRNAPLYDPETERGRYTSALSSIKQKGLGESVTDINQRLDAKHIGSQDVADAQATAAMLDAAGDRASLQAAADIYDKLSGHLTKAGQTVQAAAILARQSPEGLRFYAQRKLAQAGVQLSPQMQSDLNKLITAVKQTDSPVARHEVMKFVATNTPSSLGDKVINFWRAGLLTSPTTTFGNLLGNAGEAAVRKGFVNPVATLADKAFSLKTKRRTQTLGGGFAKGTIEGGKKLGTFVKTGYDERNALSKYDAKQTNYGDGPLGKLIGGYVNNVYKLMSVADQPFWYGARRESLQSIAKAEALNRGLNGAGRKQFMDDFVKNPPTEALERATKEAKFGTFQNETMLGKSATQAKKPLGAVGDFVIPFTQVPASIATRIVTRTPVGIASEAVKQIINVKRGGAFDQRAMSQAIGEGSFGPAVFGAGYALAGSGSLTFGYPTDAKERAIWDTQGKQPYSVKVGDRWYSLNYLQPFGTLLAIGGQAHDAVKKGASPQEAISQGIATAGQSVMNQSFLKGIGGALDAISDPERSAQKYVNNTASSAVPNVVRSFARASDPNQRDEKGLVAGVKQSIPGLREQTNVKNDVLGNPLPAKDNFANQFLNPLKPSKIRNGDEVTKEISRLQEKDSGVIPSKIAKDSLGEGTTLNPDQINSLQKNVGGSVNEQWKKLIATNEYKALSDEDKAKALKNLSTDVSAVEKRNFASKNSVGVYAQDFKGKDPGLKGKQKDIANGSLDITDYAKASNEDGSSSSSLSSDLPKDISTQAKKTLKDYDKLSTKDKEKYIFDKPSAEYEIEAAKFEKEKKSGKLTKAEEIKRTNQLGRLSAGKDTPKEVRELYTLGKTDAYKFITTDKKGEEYAKKLLAYGDALVAAGVEKKNKFRDKYGNEDFETGSTGSGSSTKKSSGKKGKGMTKLPGSPFATAQVDTNRRLQELLAGTKVKARRLHK